MRGVAEQLFGGDAVWVGSEGNWNKGFADSAGMHWHADRRGFRPSEAHLIDYPQVHAARTLARSHARARRWAVGLIGHRACFDPQFRRRLRDM